MNYFNLAVSLWKQIFPCQFPYFSLIPSFIYCKNLTVIDWKRPVKLEFIDSCYRLNSRGLHHFIVRTLLFCLLLGLFLELRGHGRS